MVAANASDATADTHWVRADVDAWMCQQAQLAGAVVREYTEVTHLTRDAQWYLQTTTRIDADEPVNATLRSEFLVDATGGAATTRRWLPIQDARTTLATNSRALFAHFSDVAKWTSLMAKFGYAVDDHPFDCDKAAQHHVIEEGWLWALRFSHNVASIGFMFDCNPLSGRSSNAQLDQADTSGLWKTMLSRYPALQAMLSDAHIVAPQAGIQLSARLQSRWRPCAGDGWALLPGTAGFIDPLHSTGIVQTLLGVERLAKRLLLPSCSSVEARNWSATYAAAVDAELTMIDQLVHGCYLTRHNPARFTSFVMLYFAAVTSFERQTSRCTLMSGEPTFLLATTQKWCDIVSEVYQMAVDNVSGRTTVSASEFEDVVRRRISEFNTAGLCDPGVRRMYRFTVAPD